MSFASLNSRYTACSHCRLFMYAQFKHCETCGHEYWADKPIRRFCSIDCRTNFRWAPYRKYRAEWIEQYESGDSYATIAKRYGLVPNTVRQFLQYYGHKPRKCWEIAAKSEPFLCQQERLKTLTSSTLETMKLRDGERAQEIP